MLGKLIIAEEQCSGRVSSLRIFCRLDISLYRDISRDGGQGYKYVVNEVNRTFSTCLFYNHSQPNGMGDGLFWHLAQALQHVAEKKFLINSPPPPPVPRSVV